MAETNLLTGKQWQPLATYGFTNSFWLVNATTVCDTWVILTFIIILSLSVRFVLAKKRSVFRYLLTSFIQYFVELTEQALGTFSFNHFSFVTALFLFIFFCNAASLIPWLEEPTQDLNTTMALGIISFMYTQIYALKAQGFREYMKEYFEPFFVMLPLNIVGKLATVISISFRLFGNIFGGATISSLYFSALQGSFLFETLGVISGFNMTMFIFFGLFEGFLQAFVFSMLTITYLAIAITQEEPTTTKGGTQ